AAITLNNFLNSLKYHDLDNYKSDFNPPLTSITYINAVDTVGASLTDHDTLQINVAPIQRTIESVDKSYNALLGKSTSGISSGTIANDGTPVDKDWYQINTTVGATYTVSASSVSITTG